MAVVSVAVVVAVVTDLHRMIIPNWLTYSLILSGLLYWGVADGWDGATRALTAMALSGLIFFIPAWFNQVGMGDVKLMAGVGAWTSFITALFSFFVASVIGLVMTLGVLFYKVLIKKRAYQEVRREPIPYAPALGGGVLLVLWWPVFLG